jgi:hypothetical protein
MDERTTGAAARAADVSLIKSEIVGAVAGNGATQSESEVALSCGV